MVMTSKELQDAALVQKFNSEALEHNYALEQKWKQYKKEYEELHTCLEEFPKELSAPILMPLGSKVFVRAQLCNTNEVFVRYDEVFTKQTAYEARSVCERHIKRCDGMIENLTKERKLLSDNFCARNEIITDSDEVKEIIEPYDEEEEAAWNERHKQKVKEYKQQLKNDAEKQKNEECENVGRTGYDVLFDLTAIQLGKKPFLVDVSDESDNDCSTNESCDDEDLDDNIDDEEDDIDDDDDDEDEDSKLEIVFTNDVPETTGNYREKTKKKVSFNNDVQIKEFEPRPEEHFIQRREETIKEAENSEILVTEIGDITEKVYDICLESNAVEENVRPMSRFRTNRIKNNNIK